MLQIQEVYSVYFVSQYISFSIQNDTIRYGCPLYMLRGHRLEFQSHFYTLEHCFILTNGADPGEMPHFESFYLGFYF